MDFPNGNIYRNHLDQIQVIDAVIQRSFGFSFRPAPWIVCHHPQVVTMFMAISTIPRVALCRVSYIIYTDPYMHPMKYPMKYHISDHPISIIPLLIMVQYTQCRYQPMVDH